MPTGVPGFGRPVFLCLRKMLRIRIRTRWLRAFHQPKFECGCCEMLVFRVCGVRQNLYVCSLYRNPDLDDRIFDCLPAPMAAVQDEDGRASFVFVGDMNIHHQEWLGSTTMNRHGVAAFDFTTVSGWDQFVVRRVSWLCPIMLDPSWQWFVRDNWTRNKDDYILIFTRQCHIFNKNIGDHTRASESLHTYYF